MAESATRRSGRKRRANPKYLFDREALRLLRESSESSRPTSADSEASGIDDTDNDFDITKGAGAEAESVSNAEEGDSSMGSSSSKGISDESEVETPHESDENISIATSGTSALKHSGGRKRKTNLKRPKSQTKGLHSRGVFYVRWRQNSHIAYKAVFGSTEEELLPIIHARDRWINARDATFPSRATLSATIREGVYGRTVTGGADEVMLRLEASEGWSSYAAGDNGKGIKSRQILEDILNPIESDRYILKPSSEAHGVIMGPWDQQLIHTINYLDALAIGDAWRVDDGPASNVTTVASDTGAMNIDPDATAGPSEGDTSTRDNRVSRPESRSHHQGWLLYFGQKVQSLAWAPNRWASRTQYLAIATPCTTAQRAACAAKPKQSKRAPAFTPSAPYPSSFQIWAFHSASGSGEEPASLDMAIEPLLVQVLCADWGNLRQLSWCPILREQRAGTQTSIPSIDKDNLGLLGIITTDGCARVLDITVYPSRLGLKYLYVQAPAFQASPPPNSVFTSLEWASPIDLILATSAGSIGIYNICSPTPSSPYLTYSIESTYILNLSLARPSLHPTLLAFASAAGALTLTDLRTPSTDTVRTSRSRLPSATLFYSPQFNTYLTTLSGAGSAHLKSSNDSMLVAHPVRRFFSGTSIGRIPGGGAVITLAGSRWHPCVIAGTAGGTVVGTNFMRRLMPQDRRGKRKETSDAYVQKLCEYEWIPLKEQMKGAYGKNGDGTGSRKEREGVWNDKKGNTMQVSDHGSLLALAADSRSETLQVANAELSYSFMDDPLLQDAIPDPAPLPIPRLKHKVKQTKDNAIFHGRDTRPGQSRFHEGFKAERVDVQRSSPIKGKAKPKKKEADDEDEEAAGLETIYEEEQAVTAADWNPNLRCAGWIAVGWGSGLVRVQDVAHGDI